jgi:hypothetical protein
LAPRVWAGSRPGPGELLGDNVAVAVGDQDVLGLCWWESMDVPALPRVLFLIRPAGQIVVAVADPGFRWRGGLRRVPVLSGRPGRVGQATLACGFTHLGREVFEAGRCGDL